MYFPAFPAFSCIFLLSIRNAFNCHPPPNASSFVDRRHPSEEILGPCPQAGEIRSPGHVLQSCAWNLSRLFRGRSYLRLAEPSVRAKLLGDDHSMSRDKRGVESSPTSLSHEFDFSIPTTMSFGGPGGGQVSYKPTPPERGSFPLE